MKKLLLIPSSKLIAEELRLDFGFIPPLLLPFGQSTVLEMILNQYKQSEYTIYIGIDEGKERLITYVNTYKKRVTTIEVGDTPSLGHTILEMIRSIGDMSVFSEMVINFGDTIVVFENENEIDSNTIYLAKSGQISRWTTVKSIDNKIQFHDKEYSEELESDVFVGVVSFSDVKLLKDCLENSIESSTDLEPLFDAIAKYNTIKKINFFWTDKWMDLGHFDNYYSARKKYFNARFFNYITYDENTNTLTKSSSEILKLENEYRWYKCLPQELQYLTPRIYSFKKQESSAELSMEYYGFPSLGELFLYSDLSLSIWESIIKKIFSIIEIFRSKITTEFNPNEVRKFIYLDKTLDRIGLIPKSSQFAFFEQESFTINSVKATNLQGLSDFIIKKINNLGLINHNKLSLIHGDLCLSNILFDVKHGIVKLIDPRGEFSVQGNYGDYLYDVAKLQHSFLGGYEFLINNKFTIVEKLSDIEINIHFEKKHKKISELFLQMRDKYFSSLDVKHIDFIESLLFISMVPFHSENVIKQKAMLAIGINKLNSI